MCCRYALYGLSAAITDDPPPEIAAARRDRRVIPMKSENLDARLDPKGDLQSAYRILDECWRPYHEHRLAAWCFPFEGDRVAEERSQLVERIQ